MIDLISDTITIPDRAMLESIMDAELGDAGRIGPDGRGEDRCTNALEDLAAEMMGMEAAMFCPTGTMANSCAVLAHCGGGFAGSSGAGSVMGFVPGMTVLTEEMQHLLIHEKICFEPFPFGLKPVCYRLEEDGSICVGRLRELIREARPALMCVENTHNFSGGKCTSVENLRQVHELCAEYGIPVHMDGARIFNAAAALGCSAAEIAGQADSVMFCVSKGLGAPIGSLLCGSRELIAKAMEWRKYLGGTMRQSGVASACGIYALTHNLQQPAVDNRNAAVMAAALKGMQKIRLACEPMSNIVLLDLTDSGIDSDEFCARMLKKGVRASKVFEYYTRFVFHSGVDEADALEAARQVLAVDEEL